MQLRAKVQLFAGPEVQPNVYTVQLGRNPSTTAKLTATFSAIIQRKSAENLMVKYRS
jgi:hypothetical protein